MQVISLLDFKGKKDIKQELSPYRTPLYESLRLVNNDSFADRLQCIRRSLAKIRKLSAELKQMNNED